MYLSIKALCWGKDTGRQDSVVVSNMALTLLIVCLLSVELCSATTDSELDARYENITTDFVETTQLISTYSKTPVGQFVPIGDGIGDLGYVATYFSIDLDRAKTIFLASAVLVHDSEMTDDEKSAYAELLQKLDLLYQHFGMSALDNVPRREVGYYLCLEAYRK